MDLHSAAREWQTHGFVILPGFVPAAELKPALAELPAMYPTAEGFHDRTDERRDRFTTDEWAGIDSFPFPSTELCLLAVSDRVVDLAETLLADSDLRISSAETWAKYTGAAGYDQALHRDYLNHTLMFPADDPRFRQLELFVYLVDVPAELGPPSMLSRTRTTGLPAKPNWYPREAGADPEGGWVAIAGSPELYEAEVRAAGPAGTVVAWAPGTFHRGTALTLARGARYTIHLGYRPAGAEWGQRMSWPMRSHELEWYRFVHRATPRQLALFGFPPPGHPYWTEATLAGTAQRYPGLNMTPWRQALRGPALSTRTLWPGGTAGMSGGFAMVRAMRVLHTSDWHLGRSLHRADLRDAQERFLDHLVATARAERVDAVLVAGDVYDRAVPPVDAVALCEQALIRLRETGARVILISGNHDSARRLGFSSALIDASGVHLRTSPGTLSDPVMLDDDHGPVAVYGVPYLEPAIGLPAAGDQRPEDGDKRPEDEVPGPRSHESVLGEAARRIRADAAARGAARTIVMAHAWVAGGRDPGEREEAARRQASDSERDISVGGIGYAPASLFDGFSYVALGHLHGQQTLAENMRYSGSPLPYSFSEASHRKGSWLVEIGVNGKTRAERVPAPVYKRLAVLRGHLDDLLSSREYTDHEGDFVAVTLTDTARPEAAMDRLRNRFPHILTLEFKPDGPGADARSYRERVKGRDDLTIAAEFVRHVRDVPLSEAEQDLLKAAFEAVREGAC